MRFTIWQMPKSLWHKNHGVFDKDTPVRIGDYCSVWTDALVNDEGNEVASCYTTHQMLNYIFKKFNLNHPRNYAGRSLSAGDIVEIDGERYLCCSTGWSKLH